MVVQSSRTRSEHFIFIYLLTGCSGSWLLHSGFLWLCEQGLLFIVEHRLLTLVASLVAEHGLWGFGSCGYTGSVVVAHGLGCPSACGIFLDQGLNSCPLNWQMDSQPLGHQGSPI